ncbi:RdRP-domain-containing protein [Microthyrium microscopicum]|uniref:RNA-dependent RNA polymerase n=1 Tax=Microthyrium microscopicum TaxID=703497 RepID=A0A6A6URM1_9PEZI|nr:RdRP-domain-containing protein [Microthyrium microscopicum]
MFDTQPIYKCMERYGTITNISISKQELAAYITYLPPMQYAFWEERQTLTLNVKLTPPRIEEQVPSPINPNKKHNALTTLVASGLDFGVMTGPNEMMQMESIQPLGVGSGFTFQCKLRREEIDVRFHFDESGTPGMNTNRQSAKNYRFRMKFNSLTEIHQINQKGGGFALVICLDSPPDYFRQTNDLAATHSNRDGEDQNSEWKDWSSWHRQTEVVSTQNESLLQQSPIALHNELARLDLGRWTTLRFTFGSGRQTYRYQELKDALQDFNIRVIENTGFNFKSKVKSTIWDHLDAHHSESLLQMGSDISSFPFSVRYQLDVCLSQGFLNEHNMTEDFLRKLNSLSEDSARAVLEKVADHKKRVYDPMDIFDLTPVRKSLFKKIPPYCALNYSGTLTPTTVRLSSPVMETSNRVLRKFREIEDRFLRIKFTEEDGGRLNSQMDSSNENVFDRVRRAMTNGLFIGGRRYEFLGFGNSQFREHSAYFFAPQTLSNTTADLIRREFGDMASIRIVSKYCARHGQNFSTTRAISTGVTIKTSLADVNRNDRCFTDGVGKISLFLAKMIAAEFKLPNKINDPPSVVQFRIAGCKGVLAVAPEVQTSEIHIRPSQNKFEGRNLGLEVIRVSQFVSATLNRQIILVLTALGVDGSAFIDMLKSMLADLELAMSDKSVALSLLQKNVDFNQMTIMVAGMVLDGFMDSNDPFLVSVLRLWRSWTVKYLKEKAKIFVSDGSRSTGGCLLGCVDEYGVLDGYYVGRQVPDDASLEERMTALPEVFVQVDDERRGTYRVLNGLVAVARNPSLHPGDIRMARAVDKPELRHLKNVVVFAQTGDRDVPSMCSGGDLDGDDYLVIWDPRLFPKKWNEKPMEYEAQKPRVLDKDVTTNDMIEFFIQYMKNDVLPKIAHAHLAWADQKKDGVMDEKCIGLAKLHSDAVDYAKSGIPAVMERHQQPPKWPHFMEKRYKTKYQTYTSKQILGQLYDMIERVDFEPVWDTPFDERILSAYDLDHDLREKIAAIKVEYDSDIRRIMAKYGIATEYEVFTAFVINHNFEKKDYTFAEELGQIAQSHKDYFREECIRVAGGNEYHLMGPFIAGMYKVTSEEVRSALLECEQTSVNDEGQTMPLRQKTAKDMPLISFPWIFVRELGAIATGQYHQDQKPMFDDGSSDDLRGYPGEVGNDQASEKTVSTPGVMTPSLMSEVNSEEAIAFQKLEKMASDDEQDAMIVASAEGEDVVLLSSASRSVSPQTPSISPMESPESRDLRGGGRSESTGPPSSAGSTTTVLPLNYRHKVMTPTTINTQEEVPDSRPLWVEATNTTSVTTREIGKDIAPYWTQRPSFSLKLDTTSSADTSSNTTKDSTPIEGVSGDEAIAGGAETPSTAETLSQEDSDSDDEPDVWVQEETNGHAKLMALEQRLERLKLSA